MDKGCVACHAINGIGGHDAPAMDAHQMDGLMNPFDFAAKMWIHAPAMIAAQDGALGDQIHFTGEELADIIAFVHDEETQHTFTEQAITPNVRAMMHHEHGRAAAPAADADEIGREHAPGTPPHRDWCPVLQRATSARRGQCAEAPGWCPPSRCFTLAARY